MQRHFLKSLYDVHSWIGLFLGLALFVVLFSGSVSLFVKELQPWQWGMSTIHAATEPTALQRAIQTAHKRMESATGDVHDIQFSVLLANRYQPWIVIQGEVPGAASLDSGPWYFDPASGTEVTPRLEQTTAILQKLHTDLLLPSPYGRYLTGILGIAMLLSTLSGVLMHRKLLKEMWSIRLWRSQRLKWADLHKSVAVWALPFHLMISFTGAFLGLLGLVIMLVAFVAFRGDVDAATAAISGAPSTASGSPALMQPIGELLATGTAALGDFRPQYLAYRHFGDAAANLQIMGTVDSTLIYYPSVTINAITGDLIAMSNWREERWPFALYGTLTPLHYATYGGIVLKIVYAVLGIGSCFLVISGLQIWQSRVHPTAGDVRLPLIVGCCYGLPTALSALLASTWILSSTPYSSYEGRLLILLAAWTAAITWAFLRRQKRAALELNTTSGALLLIAAIAGAHGADASFEDWLSAGFSSPVIAAGASLSLLGVGILATAHRISRRRTA